MKRNFIVLSTATAANLFMLKSAIEITGNDPWLKIGVSGKWEGHINGTFELNQSTFDQMVSNFEKSGVDIVCDYEHQTLYGDRAPASGWIKKIPMSLKSENGELFAKIEWTDTAKAYIESKEYRYLSPVFAPNTTSQVDGTNIGWTLHSVALTNKPFLQELDEVRLNKLNNQTKEETPMTQEEKDAMAALQAENTSLKEKNGELEATVLANKEASAVAKVDAAIAAKKIHPDQKDHALKMCKADPEGFDKFMETAKPFVAAPNSNLFDNKEIGSTGNQLSQAEINAATGGAL